MRDSEAAYLSHGLPTCGVDISALHGSSFRDYQAYQGDKFHEDQNPLGFISLGLGDNKLCTDPMASRPERRRGPVPDLLRKASIHLNLEDVVILNGYPSIFSVLAVVLCNPGEALLTLTPSMVARLHLPTITDAGTRPFRLTWTNWSKACGRLSSRYKLHVIIDEIYMLSVFDEFTKFYSVLSLKSLPVPSRTHVMWGTSKDFGISGFYFGILYTHSREAAFTVRSLGSLHVSGIIQYKLCWLLQEREWIDNVYLPTNCSRLQVAHKYITDKLNALEIRFLSCVSGLYVWFNLKKDLDTRTLEEELFLHNYFLHNKLIISCGKNYLCKEPGWFCLNSADKPDQLQLDPHLDGQAMQRLHQVLEEWKQKRIERHLQDAQWE